MLPQKKFSISTIPSFPLVLLIFAAIYGSIRYVLLITDNSYYIKTLTETNFKIFRTYKILKIIFLDDDRSSNGSILRCH
jgi:hypothetical protein